MSGNVKERICSWIKNTPMWIRIGLIALVLIGCISLIVSMAAPLGDEPGIPLGDEPGIPLIDDYDKSFAPRYYGSAYSINAGSSIHVDSASSVSVTAKVIEMLPDTYTVYDDWSQSEFKLLRMEVVKVLSGKKVPDEFVYLMPLKYMTDYSIYDKLVLKMKQYSYEYSLIYNKTQNRPQQLDKVLFVCAFGIGDGVKAFDSEGRFDMRLWESTEAWKEGTSSIVEYYGYAYYENLTLQEEERERYYPNSSWDVNLLEGVSGKAATSLAYIKALENGTYVTASGYDTMDLSPEVQCGFQRYIDGLRTNETGMLYAEKVKWSKARFTKDDMRRLPNLPAAIDTIIEALEAGDIKPSHIQGVKEGVRSSNSVFGWYAKTNRGIIGVVRVNWCFGNERYDDAYYVIEHGAKECRPIHRDDLLNVFGDYETTYIYTGEYDESGKVKRYGTRP